MAAPISAKRRQVILDGLSDGLSIAGACKAANVAPRTVRDWRNAESSHYDEAFATAADQAIEDGTDLLEDEAKRRAFDGSDTLAIFLLKGRRPTKYRDNVKVENTGPGGGAQKVEVSLSDDDAQRVLRGLVEAGLVRPGPAAAPDAEG